MGAVSFSAPFSGATLAGRIVERELVSQPFPAGLQTAFARLRTLTSTLVGERGFDALLGRATHMSRGTCPWLPKSDVLGEASTVIAVLTERTSDLGADEVKKCAIAIIGHLLDLLNSFIGEALTVRLVERAWAEAPEEAHD